jgi:hypothetical protein
MATIITRSGKGSALTHAEMDANLNNLNADKVEAADVSSAISSAITALNLGTLSTQNANSVNIDGGSIDGTTIGDTTQAAAIFTTVTATTSISSSGSLQVNGDSTIGDNQSTDTHAINGATSLAANSTDPALTVTQNGAGIGLAVTGTITENTLPVAVKTSNTGSVKLPVGTSAQRDGTPAAGYIRFNDDLDQFEGYNGTAWASVGGGATGGGADRVFMENDQTVTTNYTITTNRNAVTAGPITINSGVTVTVPAGSTWHVL